MHPYQHILLAVELNEEALQLAERSRLIAHSCGAKISIMHTLPTPSVTLSGEMSIPAAGIDQLHRESRHKVDAIAEQLAIPEERRYLVNEICRAAIEDLCQKIRVDLLILGYHEKAFFGKIFGATAEKILDRVKCDVLSVHVQSPAGKP